MAEINTNATEPTKQDAQESAAGVTPETEAASEHEQGQTPAGNDAPKYTDADVDRIINKKFGEWTKKQEREQAKRDEAARLAEMNAQERAEHERDALRAELEELKNAKTLSELQKQARAMCAEASINVSDSVLTALVSLDAEATKDAVQAYINDFNEAVKAEVKRELSHAAPKVGGAPGGITKAEILAVKDTAERQKLIAKHLDLFK